MVEIGSDLRRSPGFRGLEVQPPWWSGAAQCEVPRTTSMWLLKMSKEKTLQHLGSQCALSPYLEFPDVQRESLVSFLCCLLFLVLSRELGFFQWCLSSLHHLFRYSYTLIRWTLPPPHFVFCRLNHPRSQPFLIEEMFQSLNYPSDPSLVTP